MAVGELQHNHPQYDKNIDDWELMEDAYRGQRAVKRRKTKYLPTTSGMRALGATTDQNTDNEGWKLYESYITRAYFPEIVRDTVNALVGAMTREAPNIQLPERLEPLREMATPKGETLNVLYKRILENQLLYGRRGLLLDVDTSRDLPYIADYSHKQIINWDDINKPVDQAERKLIMVILDETRDERDNLEEYTWETVQRYRLLKLSGITSGNYMARVDRDETQGADVEPKIAGKSLDEIPFVFINTMDLVPAVGELPMLGLGNLNMTIYRGEADYRWTLFMTGQDTLVVKGMVLNTNQSGSGEVADQGSNVIIGSGAYINIPDAEGDAQFIGVSGQGLSEQREALQNDYDRAEAFGLKLLNSGAGVEAADTMRMRVAGKTANLATVTMTCAAGLQEILRMAARWTGASEEEVIVEPNLDFVQDQMGADELMKLIQSKIQGAPLSLKSIHNNMRRKDLTEFTFEEELEEIGEEEDLDFVKAQREREQEELERGEENNNSNNSGNNDQE